jgi:alpha-L-fucosidase
MIDPDSALIRRPGFEKIIGSGMENGSHWIPSEVDVSIRPGWFYHAKEDTKVKTPEQLFEIYLNSVGRGAVLLLNVPPDRRGLFHENDIKSLQGFKQIIDQEFNTNLAAKAKVTATSYRGKSKLYQPLNVTDGNKDTYWTSDDSITTGSLVIELGKIQTIKYILLQEYIKLGQRIKEFNIEIFDNNSWKQITKATTIGYKRILRIDPVTTDKIRINITASKACPLISNIETY